MSTTNRLWQVVAAAGLALLAVLLTTFYVTNYKRHVQHSEAQVSVVLAAKDIPVDTPGSELLSGKWLTKQMVPRRQVVPGAISSPEQLRTLIATQPIPEWTPAHSCRPTSVATSTGTARSLVTLERSIWS